MILIEKLFEIIISLLESAFSWLAETIEVFISGVGKRKHQLDANFISERELLSRRNTGFCLTGHRSLSTKNSYTNALIVGGTGVGKSSVVLLPSLYKMAGSFVVHDPSGELYAKASGHLASRGYDVRVLNFAKPEISAGYNPMARLKTSSDIQKLASMLVENALGKANKDPFWNQMATNLLAMVISVIRHEPEAYHNLYNVRQLLNQMGANRAGVDKLFGKYAKSDPALWLEYKLFNSLDERVTSGTLATCQAALGLLSDYAVAQVTSTDTISFEDFRNRPTALFLQTSISDVSYYSVLTTFFLEQCFAYVLSRFPEENNQDFFFLIDEAAALRFKNLQISMANVRKHRAGVMLLVQSYRQLVTNFGEDEADSIRTNCFAKMYFTGQTHDVAKEISAMLGQFDYRDEKGATVTRDLMTASEVRTMDTKHALLFCGHNRPIKAKLRPYYTSRELKAYSEMPSVKPTGASFGDVAVLPVPTLTPKPHADAAEK